MQDTESLSSTGQPTSSAEKLVKQWRKKRREKFLDKIRASLGSVRHQMAFSAAEAAIVCGKIPTWSYRKLYRGDSGDQLERENLNSESGIERYLAGAEKYNPQPKAKIGGEGNGRS